jgi:hypothetical protein
MLQHNKTQGQSWLPAYFSLYSACEKVKIETATNFHSLRNRTGAAEVESLCTHHICKNKIRAVHGAETVGNTFPGDAGAACPRLRGQLCDKTVDGIPTSSKSQPHIFQWDHFS